jgi:hypothetical protein
MGAARCLRGKATRSMHANGRGAQRRTIGCCKLCAFKSWSLFTPGKPGCSPVPEWQGTHRWRGPAAVWAPPAGQGMYWGGGGGNKAA